MIGGNGNGGGDSNRNNILKQNEQTPHHNQSQTEESTSLGMSDNDLPPALDSKLGQSVVPDLMQIYEKLTQSSTPQTVTNPHHVTGEHASHNTQQHHQQQEQRPSHSYHEDFVPPLPQSSYQHPHVAQHEYNVVTAHHGTPAPPQQAQGVPPSSYHHHPQGHHQPPPQQIGVDGVYDVGTTTIHHSNSQTNIYLSSSNHGSTQDFSKQHSDSSNTLTETESKRPVRAASAKSRKRNSMVDVNTDDSLSGSEHRPKSRKKGSTNDGRWSKRFTWPDSLHRDFVSAIFDVGLKHSSPSAILEFMAPTSEDITSERVKSHLQKYRLHRAKSKREFMESYDSSLMKFKSSGFVGVAGGKRGSSGNVGGLSCGEIAGHLTYTTIAADQMGASHAPGMGSTGIPPTVATVHDKDALPNPIIQGVSGPLQLPALTDAEKNSPIGASLGYLMGLFFSLRQQLMLQRKMMGSHAPSSSTDNIGTGMPAAHSNIRGVNDGFVQSSENTSGNQQQSQQQNERMNSDRDHQYNNVATNTRTTSNVPIAPSSHHQNDGKQQQHVIESNSNRNKLPTSSSSQVHNPLNPSTTNFAAGGGKTNTSSSSSFNNNITNNRMIPRDGIGTKPFAANTNHFDNSNNKQRNYSTRQEQNNMMKREMQNERAMLNKMREFKRNEVSKYSMTSPDTASSSFYYSDSGVVSTANPLEPAHTQQHHVHTSNSNADERTASASQPNRHTPQYQTTTTASANEGRNGNEFHNHTTNHGIQDGSTVNANAVDNNNDPHHLAAQIAANSVVSTIMAPAQSDNNNKENNTDDVGNSSSANNNTNNNEVDYW
eukprot:CAMPEP_0178965954 /NCGR_PEP_ID=MMETSP0789-20121207/16630_1 /TAXON_ID=3005 /ORGANISM="Rhizosolenia setigera, Strain CCMP 1694" /LENGTH=821 /DNA_ID=CAMNT_0020651119 /DNA_START=171 /DNA_END=2633 /DNA_ORIENTATION=+